MNEMTQKDGTSDSLGSATWDVSIVLQLADGTIAACNAAAQEILGDDRPTATCVFSHDHCYQSLVAPFIA